MYHVYKITLKNGEVYVGCTDNVRRRKDQHNENIRKQKSRLAIYISNNYPNKKLVTKDLEIQASFINRNEALKYEKSLTKSFINKVVLLNDNYNIDCSRKGKNLGNTSKEYVLIDISSNNCVEIFDLRQYCLQNNLPYKDIQKTINKNSISNGKYKVFYKQEWEDIEDKDYYLSGKFYKDKIYQNKNKLIARNSKKYLVETPTGEVIEVFNLDKFARENNLTSGTLHATYKKNKSTKGYKVIKRM